MNRFLRRPSPPGIAALILATTLLASGCETGQKGAAPPGPAPDWTALAEQQNERVDRLQSFYSLGAIRVGWQEEDQPREQQGHVDLWVQRPSLTALVISEQALGERLFWLGSNDDRYWLFDLLSEPSRMYSAPHQVSLSSLDPRFVSIQPLTLLDLLGLVALDPTDTPMITWDSDSGGWSVLVPGTAGPLRMVFAHTTGLPVQVEALDPDGEPRLVSRLSEFQSVPLDGVAIMQLPKMAEVVEIVDPSGRGHVRLFLRETSGREDDLPPARIFELERLIKSLRPEIIEGNVAMGDSRRP